MELAPCVVLSNSTFRHHLDVTIYTFQNPASISGFSEALNNVGKYPLCPNGEPFIVSALGNDSCFLDESFVVKLFENLEMIQVLVLLVATPSGLVGELGLGNSKYNINNSRKEVLYLLFRWFWARMSHPMECSRFLGLDPERKGRRSD
ncbi:hypothetical protein Leryth_023685 [Lithospermum erythrorhizon]|nr:hypothetical protein Leryth_023685 [Lithospermum erythrorhizon]